MSNAPIRRVPTREPRLTDAQWRELVYAINEYVEQLSTGGSSGSEKSLGAVTRAWSKLAQYRADRVI